MYTNPKDLTNGYSVKTQTPIDDRLVKSNLTSLQDLGTNSYKAYTYYEGMQTFVLSENQWYVWKESTSGVLTTSFTYPSNTINGGITYSGRSFNFVPIYNTIYDDHGIIVYNYTVSSLSNTAQEIFLAPSTTQRFVIPVGKIYKINIEGIVSINGNYRSFTGSGIIRREGTASNASVVIDNSNNSISMTYTGTDTSVIITATADTTNKSLKFTIANTLPASISVNTDIIIKVTYTSSSVTEAVELGPGEIIEG